MNNTENRQNEFQEISKGKVCRQVRQLYGVSQTAFAKVLHVSKNAVSDWENEKYEPSDRHWQIINSMQDIRFHVQEKVQLSFVNNMKLCPACTKKAEAEIHRLYEVVARRK